MNNISMLGIAIGAIGNLICCFKNNNSCGIDYAVNSLYNIYVVRL